MNPIIEYYGKFNEDKRLKSRHGQVEYIVSMKYIHKMLDMILAERGCEKKEIRILDLGAATGAYSIPLYEEGYDVTALELVKHNLSRLKVKCDGVKAYVGDARDLHRFQDESFDLILNFGPMYHLFSHEEKLKVMLEAKRVAKGSGIIMSAYCMNEYGVVMYALAEGHMKECMENGRFDASFHTSSNEENLYDYVRVEDIDRLKEDAGLDRVMLISPDGPTNYIRPVLKKMSDEEFSLFIDYVEAIAEKKEIIGAAAHTIDILKK